jgi:signal transduction histidine kinase
VVALGAVAYRHRWLATAAAYLVGYATILVAFGSDDGGLLTGVDGLVRIVTLALTVAAPVAFGRYLAGVRLAAAVAEERVRDAEQRRDAEMQAIRLAERARIAGDLHDLVAHHVSAIALQAGTAQYAATHAPDPEQRLRWPSTRWVRSTRARARPSSTCAACCVCCATPPSRSPWSTPSR